MVEEDNSQYEEADSPPSDGPVSIPPNAPRPLQKVSRKRTKTGCLTCRKRRIKCDEERPICSNCKKSKRNCEGYNQRVVFKHPHGVPHLAGQISPPPGPVPLAPSLGPGYPQPGSFPTVHGHQQWPDASTARQPYEQFYTDPTSSLQNYGAIGPSSADQDYPRTSTFSASYASSAGFVGWNAQSRPVPPFGNDSRGSTHSLSPDNPVTPDDNGRSTIPHPVYSFGSKPNSEMVQSPPTMNTFGTGLSQGLSQDPFPIPHQPHTGSQASYRTHAQDNVPSFNSRQESFSSDDWQKISPPLTSASNGKALGSGLRAYAKTGSQSRSIKQEEVSSDHDRGLYSTHGSVPQPSFDRGIPAYIQYPPIPIKTLQYGHEDDEEEEEEDENDPYDVEMELAESTQRSPDEAQHDLSMILTRHTSSRQRTFRTFLDHPNILATYRPSHSTSPLNDEKCSQIFCHFVAVTGPCISIFERKAPMSTSSMVFGNDTIPASQKALWTYTLPSIALGHPPLMHAILALSSLHIAKLQQSSNEPSIKHFTYALRRLGKLIALPQRRNEIPTLAAILLVGFYEILLADHSKWNIHLSGAKTLVTEIDFASMTRRLRQMRAQARVRVAQIPAYSYEDYIRVAGIPETLLPDPDWEIDEDLISKLTGYHVSYDNQWQPKAKTPSPMHDMSTKDIEDYKLQSDLYWWYCKQDIFQGMVSGNRLLMDYEDWKFCPPRGQIGKRDSTYATMDHLLLIMARLTEFGGKDQLRKRKVLAAQGGQWKPPPGFFPSGHPAAPSAEAKGPPGQPASAANSGHSRGPSHALPHSTTHHAQSSTPAPTGAPMYGMMPPPPGPPRMHTAFQAMDAAINPPRPTRTKPPPPPPPSNTDDLSLATDSALAEHAAITAAFDLFSRCLPEEYAPYKDDAAYPIQTPFGPALQYSTYPIACIWAFYHVGRILLHRLHPHMHPAAMISAGLTAHLTQNDAQIVGKICAGLYCPQEWSLQTGTLNPTLGAALMESSFSLFFAGVQFRDPEQRDWTVEQLARIARITGWQTSAAIAAGCEVCWEKMGQMGKGPPYKPRLAREHSNKNDDGRVRRGEKGWGGPGMKVEEDDEPNIAINHDRKHIDKNPNARVHFALGILGVEDDMKKLDLGEY